MIYNMYGEPYDDGFKDEDELKAACKKFKILYLAGYKKRYGFAPGLKRVVMNTAIKNIVKNYTAENVLLIEGVIAAYFADDDYFVRGHCILKLLTVADRYYTECKALKSGKTLIVNRHNIKSTQAIRDAMGIEIDYRAGVDKHGRLIH